MSDKDLYVVIAEMLRKQDQQSEILERIDSTLQEFMGITLKQFEQQQKFNENFVASLEKFADTHERINTSQGLMLNQLDTINNTQEKLSFTQEKMNTNQERLSNTQNKLAELLDKNMSEITTRLTGIENKLI